jgi:hypothetical protein
MRKGVLKVLPRKNFKKSKEGKMSQLKKEMANKCFSLLREYIDEAPLSSKKETAVLALDQLQKITAGTGSQNVTNNGSTMVTLSCSARPRAAAA